MRRRRLVLLAAVLFAALPGAVTPVPARAASTDALDLVLPTLASMLPGQLGWVSLLWTATADVCDVEVTAAGTGVTIRYPSNTGEFTSFYTNSALATGNIDFTALHIDVDGSVTKAVPLTVSVAYRLLPPGQVKKNDDLATKKVNCAGPKGAQTVAASLPVSPSSDAAVIQKTTAASVSRSTPTWTNITFRGTRPNLTNFRVSLTPPAGLKVSYPGDATSAGLHDVATLPVGADDYVSVRLDASGIAAGTYQVPLHATYTGGSFDGRLVVTVT
jgi:hypothetical protein